MQSQVQQRVAMVLQRMAALSGSSAHDARMFSDALDAVLDDIRGNDGFGTEAQRDPRGDGRDGSWSMECVEGIDNLDGAVDPDRVQQRVELVLERIGAMCRCDADDAEMFSEAFGVTLDELRAAGDFGEDGENDPRGNAGISAASVPQVLDSMTALTRSSVQDAQLFSNALECLLDDIRSEDGFGTEAQRDPRGDGRNGSWSMTYVEGIDGRGDEEEPDDALVQQRVARVLERMLAMVQADEDDAEMFADFLDEMLDELQQDDGFGSEGENDPRGDFRNGAWSMSCVEGVDD
jgi:hypothetical protein